LFAPLVNWRTALSWSKSLAQDMIISLQNRNSLKLLLNWPGSGHDCLQVFRKDELASENYKTGLIK